ncbi:hypothetical protein AL486_08485 [Pandoraea apista]|uniref:FliH/SctL family protein n=1 Tax=Pandoraea apista TaxID=93218 RepID=UPI000CE93C31|nr:FliH/SctL family protein [Pandoraea apista]AVF39737.1 hypothetical protein AL486_08485 [Pandoraea apista]
MKPHRFGTKSDIAAQRGWLPVHPDLDTLRAQAYAQGMADGAANTREVVWQEAFDAGRVHGEQAAEARLQTSHAEHLRDELEALKLPLEALHAAREQVHSRLAAAAVDVLSDVASRAVRAIVQRELHTAPADIESIVARLLAQLGGRDDAVTVYVSPADARALCARVGSASAHADGPCPGWRIEADPSLVRGDCRVDVDGLWYDAGCEGREAAAQAIARRHLSEWGEATRAACAPAATSETL